jgi:methyl halide transferase
MNSSAGVGQQNLLRVRDLTNSRRMTREPSAVRVRDSLCGWGSFLCEKDCKSKESIARSPERRARYFPFLTGYLTLRPNTTIQNGDGDLVGSYGWQLKSDAAPQPSGSGPDEMTKLGSRALLARAGGRRRVSANRTNVLRVPGQLRSANAGLGRPSCFARCAEQQTHSVAFRRSATATEGGSGGGVGEKTVGDVRVMQERFANAVRHLEQPVGDSTFSSAGNESLWESLWKDGITPWDLGHPTATLVSELARQYPTDGTVDAKRTVRVLVPGCGAGYDLISLLVHFNALVEAGKIRDATIIGLDLSPTSLSRASDVLEEFFSAMPATCSTQVLLVHGDYFKPTTEWKAHSTYGGTIIDAKHDDDNDVARIPSQYDFLFDYTFFCALPPSARELWGLRTSQLLHPSEESRILTLMFPVLEGSDALCMYPAERHQKMSGPPFPVLPLDYQRVLEPHAIIADSHPYSSPDTDRTRVGKELVCWWRRRR